ncbi:MAG: hypothetical protein RLZZ580_1331 [Cyanobacteriota bacterium]|jgi:hypothetical protein
MRRGTHARGTHAKGKINNQFLITRFSITLTLWKDSPGAAEKERVSFLGSGAIESGIKQIGKRVKLSGAPWQNENVSSILSLRCAYLNGVLSR